MRTLFFILCFGGFLSNTYAIGAYQLNDTLYVWAYNGLLMRTKPDPKGAKLKLLPYGAAVVVISKNSQWAHQVQEYGGFRMYGHWVEVSYMDSLKAYVFDGYLSNFPAKTYQRKNEEFNGMLAYFESVWGTGKVTRKGYQPESAHCRYQKEIYTYPNGTIAVQECGEGGYIQTLEIPGFSFEEAYLLLFLNPRLYYIKNAKGAYADIPLDVSVQTREEILMQYEMTTYVFEKKAGKILIKYWSSC